MERGAASGVDPGQRGVGAAPVQCLTMRRLLVICLLLALPLQGSWAAVNGGCCGGQPCPNAMAPLADADAGAGVPAHDGPGHGPADTAQPCDVAVTGSTTPCDAGCPQCQGSGAAALMDTPVPPAVTSGQRHPPAVAVQLPDPLPDHLLRPPRLPRA